MQRILFLSQFWRANQKVPQPAKASAGAGDEARVRWLLAAGSWLLAKQRARAGCNRNAALASDSQCQSCSKISSVSAVALTNDLALQQKLELLHYSSSAAPEATAALLIIKNYIIKYYFKKTNNWYTR
jgi:hypothetical protein